MAKQGKQPDDASVPENTGAVQKFHSAEKQDKNYKRKGVAVDRMAFTSLYTIVHGLRLAKLDSETH